ncbi:hypothetical protein B0O99DRAFT_691485 [Bisporella sp. PMI_857]|nr:hypothetical protein B0O99DRAFT_691485 [Bisporella sp. PMI_857]
MQNPRSEHEVEIKRLEYELQSHARGHAQEITDLNHGNSESLVALGRNHEQELRNLVEEHPRQIQQIDSTNITAPRLEKSRHAGAIQALENTISDQNRLHTNALQVRDDTYAAAVKSMKHLHSKEIGKIAKSAQAIQEHLLQDTCYSDPVTSTQLQRSIPFWKILERGGTISHRPDAS